MVSEEFKSEQFILDESISEWYVPAGTHEKELIDSFRKVGQRVFIDVGAHLGTWTLRLSPYFKKVIAFEPCKDAYKSLVKNLSLNYIKNVLVEKIALSNENNIGELFIFDQLGNSSLLFDHPHKDIVGVQKSIMLATTECLDHYLMDNEEIIDLIKIDVEGYEDKVLLGALKTLERYKPSLLIEVHSESAQRSCKDILSSIGIHTEVVKWGIQDHLVFRK